MTLPYVPRAVFDAYHDRTQRWAVIVAHRRAGKTVATINDLVRTILNCKLPNLAAGTSRPTYSQSKKVAWTYLKEPHAAILGYKANEAELRVDFLGDYRVQLAGADNPDSLRGIYADGVVMDEFAFMAGDIWSKIIRPALADRQGAGHVHPLRERPQRVLQACTAGMARRRTGSLPTLRPRRQASLSQGAEIPHARDVGRGLPQEFQQRLRRRGQGQRLRRVISAARPTSGSPVCPTMVRRWSLRSGEGGRAKATAPNFSLAIWSPSGPKGTEHIQLPRSPPGALPGALSSG